jgi:hypothetical protein
LVGIRALAEDNGAWGCGDGARNGAVNVLHDGQWSRCCQLVSSDDSPIGTKAPQHADENNSAENRHGFTLPLI